MRAGARPRGGTGSPRPACRLGHDPLHRAVGEVGHGHPDAGRQRGRVHRVVVVLRGDPHRAGGLVAHRVVGAVVAEAQLVGPAAEREGEQLVAEADAEQRHPAQELRGSSPGRRRPRPGRPARWRPRRPRASSARIAAAPASGGTTDDLGAGADEVAQDRALGAAVDHDDDAARRPGGSGDGACGWRRRATARAPARHASVSVRATSRVRSQPSVPRAARDQLAQLAALGLARRTPARPGSAPFSRRWSTSARVSNPHPTGTPCASSRSSSRPAARQFEGTSDEVGNDQPLAPTPAPTRRRRR